MSASQPVCRISTDETRQVYKSAREAARMLKIDPSAIGKACRGEKKSCGGYKWEYSNIIMEDYPPEGKKHPVFTDYIIYQDGRVYSIKYCKFMTPQCHSGYGTLSLKKNGKPYNRKIHRLVADVYLENPENLPEVNHKDGKRLNNNVKNLEWCTRKENCEHAHANKLTKGSNISVCEYTQDKKLVNTYASIMDASRKTGLEYTGLRKKSKKGLMASNGHYFVPKYSSEKVIEKDEEFRPIPEFPQYKISSYGKVYSEKSNGYLSTHKNKAGYVKINIRENGCNNGRGIHQLIAQAFLEPPKDMETPEVHHIDSNPSNNHVSNLMWVTHSENMKESLKRRMRTVIQYNKTGEEVQTHENVVKAGEYIGVQQQSIRRACVGETKTCKGYIWKYKE